MSAPLSVVYCLDAEGPLTEYPHDTVMRLMREHGLDRRIAGEPAAILAAVQAGVYGPALADVAAPHRLAFLNTWEQVTAMLADLTSDLTRKEYADSDGNPLRISWFVIDLIGYRSNPRQRAQGQHAVWNHVAPFFGSLDGVGWHVHTLTPDRDPLAYGTSWPPVVHEHEAALCHRLLDQHHFPASFRAGGAIERNDLSHWLERFIPFDYSCLPGASTHGMDWPAREPYHPHHDDYRRPGAMYRRIFPCHDADSWASRVTAIPEGNHLAFATHDRTPVRPQLDRIVQLLNASGRPWKWQTASKAWTSPRPILSFDDPERLTLKEDTSFGDVRGEPFVAVDDGTRVYRVNARPEKPGTWRIDRPASVRRLGAAITTRAGHTGLAFA